MIEAQSYSSRVLCCTKTCRSELAKRPQWHGDMCPYATVADTQEQRKAFDSEVLEEGGVSGHIHQTHTHTSDVLAAYLCSYVPQEVTRCEQILVKAVPAEIHDVCSRLLAECCDLFTAHVGSHASGGMEV